MYMSLFLRSGKLKINNSGISLLYLQELKNFIPIPFICTKYKKVNWFSLFIYTYIFSHFHNVDKLSWYTLYFDMSLYVCFYFANSFYFHIMIHVISKKWKKYQTEKLENTLYVYICKLEKIYHILLFIITKWIIFHQCHLFPQSGKALMIYITSRNCKVSLFPRRGKNEVIPCIYLYIWFYFHELQSVAPTPFIHIWFSLMFYISPMYFISTKRKKL